MDYFIKPPDDNDPADAWKKEPPQFVPKLFPYQEQILSLFSKDMPFEPPLGFTPHEHKIFSQLTHRMHECHIPDVLVNDFFCGQCAEQRLKVNAFFEGKNCLIVENIPGGFSLGFLKPKGKQ